MGFIDLAASPFNLDAEAIAWVETTRDALAPRDKLAQLFVLLLRGDPQPAVDLVRTFRPGGITRIYGESLRIERAAFDLLSAASPIPLLVSADLEGSRASIPFGTPVPNPLGLAAIDDVDTTLAISTLMAAEAHAVGLNWSFTPLIDIAATWRSPIVATRSFGSDVDRIERHALAQIEAFQANGVAATVKHWPGEGFDDRDQHLVTTVNPLAMPDWETSFGRLYRAAIKAGVMSVMSAHIALPAYVRARHPDAGAEAFRPASVSRLLNQDLLRGELGFNGLIVSDATGMAGLGDWGPRDQTVPDLIASGCDVILFSNDPNADLMRLVKAVADGRLSQERVDEAVTRVLALKAALGLHRGMPLPDTETAQNLLGSEQHRALSRHATQRAPTVVKDVKNLLPLDPSKHHRVLVFSTGVVLPFAPAPIPLILPDRLRQAGFDVTLFTPDLPVKTSDYDLVLYLLAEETLMTRGRIFLNWRQLTGSVFGAMARYWHDLPTLMISFGYPYYLHDAPRVPAYINAYGSGDDMQEVVLDAILGRTPFSGTSPVDPFCGSEQARY